MLFAYSRSRQYIAYFFMSVAVSGFLFMSGRLYDAHELADAEWALKIQTFWLLALIPAYIVFISDFTKKSLSKPSYLLILACVAILMAANISSPAGFKFVTLYEPTLVDLSLFGTVPIYLGEVSSWNWLFRTFLIFVFLWQIFIAKDLLNQRNRREFIHLTIYGSLFMLSATHGFLIEYGAIESFYSAGFTFLAVIVLMSFELTDEIQRRGVKLQLAANSLKSELERRKQAESELNFIAYYDFLTGLPNRNQINICLGNTLVETFDDRKLAAVLMIDLDHFKNINDSLGHDVGDQLLIKVSEKLREIVDEGVFLGRFGGDDFVVISGFNNLSESEGIKLTKELAKKILKGISTTYSVDDRVISIGASIGCSIITESSDKNIDLMRQVELALYKAKSKGRNTFEMYDASLLKQVARKLEIDRELRTAVAKKQLHLHYQPQLTGTGEVYGAEALARWDHPTLGPISPVEFIEVAEETGQIHALGEWVIKEGCRTLKSWIDRGLNFHGTLSLNVSPWQFMRSDFVAKLLDIVRENDLNPARLKIEITESAVLYDLEGTIQRLHLLRQLGFGIALDDFGTGYSSLAHVKHLPLDLVKIDRAFVSELSAESHNPMVRSMISLCDCMKVNVIAEGIETAEQRDLLVSFNCALFQGYFFSKPLSQNDFEQYIENLAN
jgi:diguanylate cyclase